MKTKYPITYEGYPTPPATGDMLVWDGSEWVSVTAQLSVLTDLQLSASSDLDILYYNVFQEKWINQKLILNLISDVSVPSPQQGDLLRYHGNNWSRVDQRYFNITASIWNVRLRPHGQITINTNTSIELQNGYDGLSGDLIIRVTGGTPTFTLTADNVSAGNMLKHSCSGDNLDNIATGVYHLCFVFTLNTSSVLELHYNFAEYN